MGHSVKDEDDVKIKTGGASSSFSRSAGVSLVSGSSRNVKQETLERRNAFDNLKSFTD